MKNIWFLCSCKWKIIIFKEQDHEKDNLYFGGLPSGTTKEHLETTILHAIADSFEKKFPLKEQLVSIRVQPGKIGRFGKNWMNDHLIV